MQDYKQTAREARLRVLEMIYHAKSSHIGSNFSVIDIFTVLFANLTKDDQVILSAGWKAAAFYYFLAKAGYYKFEELDTYNQEGSRLIGLTEPGVPGVLFAGGSMQMGLPAAVGFALAKKIKGEPGKVYCIMSDGELAGGMVWESALIAVHHKLDNLYVIVDNNGLQAMGKTKEILNISPVSEKFDAFGWDHRIIDGHSFEQIESVILKQNGRNLPFVLIAGTTKGKGVSFMENQNLYHYKDLSDEIYEKARAELSI